MTDNILEEVEGITPLDPNKNYLTELVGPNAKFKTVEDMAYGKAQSDVYVKLLERQMDQMKLDLADARAEAAARARLEDLVDKINKPNPIQPPVVTELPKPEIKMTDIESLVSKKIQETETNKRHKENLDMVKAKLSERFGNNLENHLKEVGLDGESAAQLAKINPQLVLKALGVDNQPEPYRTAPPRNTSVNTPNKHTPQRTWQYYQDLFKANPNLKYDSKTNTQMQKDYASLGSTFEDGDFHRFG